MKKAELTTPSIELMPEEIWAWQNYRKHWTDLNQNNATQKRTKYTRSDLAARPMEVTINDLVNTLMLSRTTQRELRFIAAKYPNGIRIVP